jgi:hypothetical protein
MWASALRARPGLGGRGDVPQRRLTVEWPGKNGWTILEMFFWFGHVRVYIWLKKIGYIWQYDVGPCRIWDGNNGKRIRKLEIWSLILERKKKTGEKDESERTSTFEICRRFRRGPKHRTWLQ